MTATGAHSYPHIGQSSTLVDNEWLAVERTSGLATTLVVIRR